jgi:hypothetical protein
MIPTTGNVHSHGIESQAHNLKGSSTHEYVGSGTITSQPEHLQRPVVRTNSVTKTGGRPPKDWTSARERRLVRHNTLTPYHLNLYHKLEREENFDVW